jgi:two-component system, chemotaxis family, protein-glutamate methylesterase/glutaminase
MRLKPTPVVMVSSLTERGADATLRALELGAVDFVAKPKLGIAEGLRAYADEIGDKIRAAAHSKVRRPTPIAASGDAPRAPIGVRSTETVIAIGSSTGGTEALRVLLQRMPPDSPGIVVTQHMPPGFTRSFAERLDQQCKVRVHEAQGGERVLPGHVFIAPGDRHLVLKRSGANYVTAIVDSEPVNRHRPSVDVLFQSVAQSAGANAIGVMLTGMGKDGAHHMRTMREAGAWNVAQDEASCVVFGMPKEAIAAGGVDEVLPLTQIADRIFTRLGAQGQRHVRV